MEATAMETALNAVGTFFGQSITWMGDVFDFVIEHPLAMIMVFGMPIAGFAVGLLGRLIRL
ncbi:MAG: hypothetical protein IJ403_10760 [Oscillospiraceae bacterium]|nr:hypothetical protein [Oscillospiraceae bacterium]